MPRPSSPARREVHAKAALDELRALSAGVAPPLLQDRGLAAALAAVAAGSAAAGRAWTSTPRVDAAVSPEIARTVYFVVAELLDERRQALRRIRGDAQGVGAARAPATHPPMLDVWVVDNGRGGPHPAPGHGLEGLRDRVAGLRGVLVVDSRPGRADDDRRAHSARLAGLARRRILSA